jgi:hypothetical protein
MWEIYIIKKNIDSHMFHIYIALLDDFIWIHFLIKNDKIQEKKNGVGTGVAKIIDFI